MITFACHVCQKQFNVPDSYAGRRARCKGCANEVRVPVPAPAQDKTPELSRPPLRVRRLMSDADAVKIAFSNHPHVRVQSTVGDPAETYRFTFKVKGLTRDAKGRPAALNEHVAEIQLGADYPRLPPVCKMISPIFHPNIDTSYICIGDHWTAGERLVDLVTRIAEMIGYQAYNIRSPLDGEAAMWADLNASKLPLDATSFTIGR